MTKQQSLTQGKSAETSKDNDSTQQAIALLNDIKKQNETLLKRVEEQEINAETRHRETIKRSAVTGAVSGGAAGGVVAVFVEILRAKLGL